MAKNSENIRDRADAAFLKKEQQARAGETAMADYEAAAHAVQKKTQRLRALRLAKEEAERLAAPEMKPVSRAKKPGSPK